MTALVRRLSAAVKSERPEAQVSAAAAPDAEDALEHRLQDWGGWLKADLIDAICPMAYTTEPGRFAELIAGVRDVAGTRPVWAGIADMAEGHLSYPAAAAAVASGIMPLREGGRFDISRPVSGAEAADVIGRLRTLANAR